MTYDVLDVDPDLYLEAGDRARRAARQIREAVDSAVAAHSGSHNAAGKGDAGNAFADGHDEAARSLISGAGTLATALDGVADRMALSALTHAAAEWASSGRAGDPPGYPVPVGSQSTSFGAIPSMHGGTGSTPQGWDLIQLVMSFVEYPDADTDKVHRAGSVWTTLGDDLARIQSSVIDTVLEPLASVTAPDVAAVHALVQPIVDFGRRLSKAPAELASFCRNFAELAAEVTHFIVTVLEQLLFAVVAQEAAGVLLTIISLGASDFLANAAAVAEALGAGERIVAFIATFYERVVAAVNLCTEFVRGILEAAPEIKMGSSMSKVAFVSVKTAIGGGEGAVISGGWYAVKHHGDFDVREFVDVTATGAAAGAIGGGLSDGLGELWENGTKKATSGIESRVPGTADEVASGEAAPAVETAPAAEGAPAGQDPAPPPTRRDITAQRRSTEKTRSTIAGGAAAASIAATDLLSGEESFTDPATLLDPNVARLRERLNESVVEAGRDRLGK